MWLALGLTEFQFCTDQIVKPWKRSARILAANTAIMQGALQFRVANMG